MCNAVIAPIVHGFTSNITFAIVLITNVMIFAGAGPLLCAGYEWHVVFASMAILAGRRYAMPRMPAAVAKRKRAPRRCD
jgi:hypothetical protein